MKKEKVIIWEHLTSIMNSLKKKKQKLGIFWIYTISSRNLKERVRELELLNEDKSERIFKLEKEYKELDDQLAQSKRIMFVKQIFN